MAGFRKGGEGEGTPFWGFGGGGLGGVGGEQGGKGENLELGARLAHFRLPLAPQGCQKSKIGPSSFNVDEGIPQEALRRSPGVSQPLANLHHCNLFIRLLLSVV